MFLIHEIGVEFIVDHSIDGGEVIRAISRGYIENLSVENSARVHARPASDGWDHPGPVVGRLALVG